LNLSPCLGESNCEPVTLSGGWLLLLVLGNAALKPDEMRVKGCLRRIHAAVTRL
jgi:hypothetical protein